LKEHTNTNKSEPNLSRIRAVDTVTYVRKEPTGATEAISLHFEGRTSYALRLFRDMLYSTKSTHIS